MPVVNSQSCTTKLLWIEYEVLLVFSLIFSQVHSELQDIPTSGSKQSFCFHALLLKRRWAYGGPTYLRQHGLCHFRSALSMHAFYECIYMCSSLYSLKFTDGGRGQEHKNEG